MSKIQNLGLAGCFSALTACGAVQDNYREPPSPSIPLPEFTEREVENIDITLAFLNCAINTPEEILNSFLFEAVIEGCTKGAGFDFDVYDDVIAQYTERYGDDWPHMVSALFKQRRMALSM